MHNTKERLSLLWIFALLNYLYADVVALFAIAGTGKYPSGEGHTFAVVDCVVDWMHEQDVIPVRTS